MEPNAADYLARVEQAVQASQEALAELDRLTSERATWEEKIARARGEEDQALNDHSLTEKQATERLAATDRLLRVLEKRFGAYKLRCGQAVTLAYDLSGLASDECRYLAESLEHVRKFKAGQLLDGVLIDYRYVARNTLINHSRGAHEAYVLAGQFPRFPQLNSEPAQKGVPFMLGEARKLPAHFAALKAAVEAEDNFRLGVDAYARVFPAAVEPIEPEPAGVDAPELALPL